MLRPFYVGLFHIQDALNRGNKPPLSRGILTTVMIIGVFFWGNR